MKKLLSRYALVETDLHGGRNYIDALLFRQLYIT